MAALIIHHMHAASISRWATLLTQMILNLMLHPVLVDTLRAGLR